MAATSKRKKDVAQCLQHMVSYFETDDYADRPLVGKLTALLRSQVEQVTGNKIIGKPVDDSSIFHFLFTETKQGTMVQKQKPIVDVQLTTSKKAKDVPEGYELIADSVSGILPGDCNRANKYVAKSVCVECALRVCTQACCCMHVRGQR